MTFTTLMLFQLFNVINARSDERSAFEGLFRNHWPWAAIGFSLVLHAAVIYLPFLQQAFSTTTLTVGDWLYCAAVASSVLWLRELSKTVTRARQNSCMIRHSRSREAQAPATTRGPGRIPITALPRPSARRRRQLDGDIHRGVLAGGHQPHAASPVRTPAMFRRCGQRLLIAAEARFLLGMSPLAVC